MPRRSAVGAANVPGATAVAKIVAAVVSTPRTVELLGMKMSWEGKPEAAVHDGVAIAEYVMKLDLSGFPAPQREMMRRMYGEEGMQVYVAGFDKSLPVLWAATGNLRWRGSSIPCAKVADRRRARR